MLLNRRPRDHQNALRGIKRRISTNDKKENVNLNEENRRDGQERPEANAEEGPSNECIRAGDQYMIEKVPQGDSSFPHSKDAKAETKLNADGTRYSVAARAAVLALRHYARMKNDQITTLTGMSASEIQRVVARAKKRGFEGTGLFKDEYFTNEKVVAGPTSNKKIRLTATEASEAETHLPRQAMQSMQQQMRTLDPINPLPAIHPLQHVYGAAAAAAAAEMDPQPTTDEQHRMAVSLGLVDPLSSSRNRLDTRMELSMPYGNFDR